MEGDINFFKLSRFYSIPISILNTQQAYSSAKPLFITSTMCLFSRAAATLSLSNIKICFNNIN